MTVAYLKRHRLQVLAAFSLVTFVLGLSVMESAVASCIIDSNGLVKQAEESVNMAFNAVLDAEAAGANVSELVMELNQAAGLLSKAKIALENSDFDETTEDLASIVEMTESVKDKALLLKTEALSHRDFIFQVSLVVSLVGVPAFLVLMLFIWRWLKGHYMHRVLGLKPEVILGC